MGWEAVTVSRKACPPNDVAAAQGQGLRTPFSQSPGDLKKLSLGQLLALRIVTKDFPTTSVGPSTPSKEPQDGLHPTRGAYFPLPCSLKR